MHTTCPVRPVVTPLMSILAAVGTVAAVAGAVAFTLMTALV